jgi:hypothetical protein
VADAALTIGGFPLSATPDFLESIVLDLLDTFSGNLFVALNFTHGNNLAYTISAPSNAGPATPTAVPLPAGLLLIGTAIGGLGLTGLRRRRAT